MNELEIAKKTSLYSDELRCKTVLVTGATGLIGKQFTDLLMHIGDIKVVAVGRDNAKIKRVFANYIDNKNFFTGIINGEVKTVFDKKVDYIVHCASPTRPEDFKADPAKVFFDNIRGIENILNFAKEKKVKKMLYLSSVEVYGNPHENQKQFAEDDYGVINLADVRSAYPESKRVCELLLAIRRAAGEVDYVIARPAKTFGITPDESDKRAGTEFIRLASQSKDIVLMTKGGQKFSFCYNADVAAALLLLLIKGESGQAYNIASNNSDVSIFEFASVCAEVGNSNVIIKEQSNTGHSTYSHTIVSIDKIKKLGFCPAYTLQNGVRAAIEMLRETNPINRGEK